MKVTNQFLTGDGTNVIESGYTYKK